jgi:tyrocidine synthetase-3
LSDTQGVCLDDEALRTRLAMHSEENPAVSALTSTHLAYVIYTSGSTGQPKGVMIEHRNVSRLMYAAENHFKFSTDDVWSLFHSYAFDFSVWEMWGALAFGGKLVVVPYWVSRSPSDFYQLLKEKRITVLNQTPSAFNTVIHQDMEQNELLALRYVIFGGEAVNVSKLQPWIKKHGDSSPELINMYGITETTVHVTYKKLTSLHIEQDGSSSLIGLPLGDLQVAILDSEKRCVPKGVIGELYVTGAGVSRGYLNRSELTNERFCKLPRFGKDRFYRTGDLVRCLPDGELEYLGRADHQVKIRGFRIELGEIESRLLAHDKVREAVVLAKEKTVGDMHLVAYIQIAQGEYEHILTSELRTYLGGFLPEFMVPAYFICVTEMPLTKNGKLESRLLPDPDWVGEQQQYTAPNTELEKCLCSVWQDVLGKEQVGVHDNFFQMGGHSLLAMTVISRLQQANVNLTIRQLYEKPYVISLAAELERGELMASAPFAVPTNLIPNDCLYITPQMLPMVELTQNEINHIAEQVPGGIENIQDIYPLGPLQEGILFHHMMSDEGDAYVIPLLFQMDNKNDVNKFIDGLQRLINKHDILRTGFYWDNLSNPVQAVCRNVVLPVVWYEPSPGLDIADYMHQLSLPQAQFMDLTSAPLVALQIAEDQQNECYLLLLQIHHIIDDAISLQILQKELLGYMADKPDDPTPSVPYRDFIAHCLHQAKNYDAKAFFAEKLGDICEPTAPFELLDIKGDGSRITQFEAAVPVPVCHAIRHHSKVLSVSPAAMFHAAWALVVSACSGRNDVVFGSVVSGRLQGLAGVENILGVLINTVPLRVKIGNENITDFVQQLHNHLMEILPYEQTPLSQIQRLTQLPTDAPLFTSIINYRHLNRLSEELQEAEKYSAVPDISYIGGQERTNYPFNLLVNDMADEFTLVIQVDSDINAQRVMAYVQSALSGLVEKLQDSDEHSVTEVQVIPEQEVHEQLVHWNNPQSCITDNQCLHEYFEQQVLAAPDAIAVSFQGHQLSYLELNNKANQLAHFLREQGHVKENQLIGLCVARSVEMIISILAILKAGGAYVPIDPTNPPERIAYVIEDAGLSTLLTTSDIHIHIEVPTYVDCIFIDHQEHKERLKNYAINNISPVAIELQYFDLAYIIYTSGSTGKPKGVMVEHRNVKRLFSASEFGFSFNAQDVWTMFHSFAFDFSVWEMWGAFLYGGKLLLVSQEEARSTDDFYQLVASEGVTVLSQTPRAFNQFIQIDTQKQLPLALRYVVFGGEELNLAALELWIKRHGDDAPKLINMYGITETTVHVTYRQILEEDVRQESAKSLIGKPLADLGALVLSNNHTLLPVGVVGELYVAGEGVTRGYLNQPALTEQRFISNPFNGVESSVGGNKLYRTGDLVRWLDNGELEYCGRIDNQVKIRGFRIELGEIEQCLIAHESIRQTVVIVHETTANDQQLIAYIVANDGVQDDEHLIHQLDAQLRAQLPGYMIPSHIVTLSAIPLTANGKVDKQALPEVDKSRTVNSYVAPRSENEKILAEIWQDILEIEAVGVTDNFFELGGHSLSVIRLVVSVNKALGANVKAKDVYLAPTIKMLLESADLLTSSTVLEELRHGESEIAAMQQKILTDPVLKECLPANYDDFYPLSTIQQSMVFFALASPEVPLYHDLFPSLHYWPEFNIDCFKTAVALLCERNAILRTSFDVHSFDTPMQIVHQNPEQDIRFTDLSALTVSQQEESIARSCQRDIENKFTFSGESLLWRIHLFALGDDKFSFVFSCQHAILDGWSVNALMKELEAHYVALKSEHQPTIMPVLEQKLSTYRDYVAINLGRENSEQAETFWQAYLQGYARTKLPFNYTGRTVSNDLSMQTMRRLVGKKQLQGLQESANKYAVTVKELCLAAHVYLLSLLTGDDEILTGVVSHDRPELEGSSDILGCFLNTVPLRLPALRNGDIQELAVDVKKHLQQIKTHELFLGDIARIVDKQSSLGRPLFDTLFNFTDFPNLEITEDLIEYSEPDIKVRGAEMTNTLFDLEVHKQANCGLSVHLKYRTQFFHQQEMEIALGLYVQILDALSQGNSTLCLDKLIPENMLGIVQPAFNDTCREYALDMPIHTLFEKQARQAPALVALKQQGKTLSYAQLNARANKIAHLLLQQGIKPGQTVGVVMQRSFDLIASIFAILKIGAAYVPMEPHYPSARKQAIEQSAQLSLILVDHSVSEQNPLYLEVEEKALESLPDANLSVQVEPNDLAYIIYTSGSTGTPKGVRIHHHSVVNLLEWVNRRFNVVASDVMLFLTSVCFDLSVYDIFGPLSVGASLVIVEQDKVAEPTSLFQVMEQEKVTFWDSVPSTMGHLINELYDQTRSLDSLRLVFLSGDWIPVQLPEQINTVFPNAEVISLGGATEGTVWSNYYPIKEVCSERHSIPYGKPIDNNRFYVLDSQHCPVMNGVAGELYIAGVGVADGYQGDSEKTAKAFFDDPFHQLDINGFRARIYKTGDLGRIMPCGNMEILGRVDHQVKLRGFRIELGEVEAVISRHNLVKEAVVTLVDVAQQNNQLGNNQILAAYIVMQQEVDFVKEALIQELKEHLPEYMVPKVFTLLDKLPLTANGKIDRQALPTPQLSSEQRQCVAPVTGTEQQMCKIWQDLLGVCDISINDNFFELGGHSLAVTRLVSKVNQELNVNLDLRVVFTVATLEELCASIDAVKYNNNETQHMASAETEEGVF